MPRRNRREGVDRHQHPHFCLFKLYRNYLPSVYQSGYRSRSRFSLRSPKPRGVIAALLHARPEEDSFGRRVAASPLARALGCWLERNFPGEIYYIHIRCLGRTRAAWKCVGVGLSHAVFQNQANIGFWVLRRDYLAVRHFDEEAFFRDLIQHNRLSICWVSKCSWEVGFPYGLRQIQKSFGEVQIPNEDHNLPFGAMP